MMPNRFMPQAQTVEGLHQLQLQGLQWTVQHAYHGSSFYHHRLQQGGVAPEDIHSLDDAASKLGVNATTVVRWVEGGLLKGVQVAKGAPWRIYVTQDDVRRLTVTDAPEGWVSLKGAASALRVSQRTVLQRLNSGKLEGVRVQVGARSAWRIHVPPDVYDNHPTLF